MSKALNRRDFLKFAAAGAGAAILSGCSRLPQTAPPGLPPSPSFTPPPWTSTPPPTTTPAPSVTPTPTPTVEPPAGARANYSETAINGEPAVWQKPSLAEMAVDPDPATVPGYAQWYMDITSADLAKMGIQAERIEYRQNSDGTNWTLLAYTEDDSVVWAEYAGTNELHAYPLVFDLLDGAYHVANEAGGRPLEYIKIQGVSISVIWPGDIEPPVLVDSPVDFDGQKYTRYWDHAQQQWVIHPDLRVPAGWGVVALVQLEDSSIVGIDKDGKKILVWKGNKWDKYHEYGTTEFEGEFSEKYPPSFTQSFEHEIEPGLTVKVAYGVTSDHKIKEYYLNEEGKKLYAELWLGACYDRYTEVMGNKVTMEEYIELVKKGEGDIDVWIHDEETGERKLIKVNPTKGVSSTLTHNPNLPLTISPHNADFSAHAYITANKFGQVIIVIENNKTSYQRDFNHRVYDMGYPAEFILSSDASMGFTGAMTYFARLRPVDFLNNGGLMKVVKSPVIDSIIDKFYQPLIGKINPKTDKYPFVESIKY